VAREIKPRGGFTLSNTGEKKSQKQLMPLPEPGLTAQGDTALPHDCTPARTLLQLIRKADLKYRSRAFLIILK